ncbi:MAG: small ribosomal subunit Rsm22 family protein [Parachlamydiales bacterium]|jgi:ribosomal protein RSM22 (predicted rRNA methylase)
MQLPEKLLAALMSEAEKHSLRLLADSREVLTHRYKFREGTGQADEFIRTEDDRLTYVLSRMPATFAAVESCLTSWKNPEGCQSVLDVGAGPGTASWAALTQGMSGPFTLVERDAGLISLGKKLATESGLASSLWVQADLTSLPDIQAHDLVICSYALGEIPLQQRMEVLKWLWSKAKVALLVVEPGSKAGFEVIRAGREQLLLQGAAITAPCPHAFACPMPEGDWCHFSVRLERTPIHRYLKKGSLSYEDEKFSYVLFERISSTPTLKSRIVGYPDKHSGHLALKLCVPEGQLKKETISRKEGERYKLAKKASWGDLFI